MTDQKLMVCSGPWTGEQIGKADGLTRAAVSVALRGASLLELDLHGDSRKLKMFENPSLEVRVGGKTYHTLELIEGRVVLYEIWDLLGYTYPTIDQKVPLRVRLPADAPHRLIPRLLEGTEWKPGIIDAGGEYLLETDLLSTLENLRLLELYSQSWLIFDSPNKTISLRDDLKWRPLSGVEIDRSLLTKTIDLRLVTELIPLGFGERMLSTVNNREIHLTRNPYALERRQTLWRNPGVTNENTLKRLGEDRLAVLSCPRTTYKGEIRSEKPLHLGDMVTVLDEEPVTVRVLSLEHDLFEPGVYGVTLANLISENSKELIS
jgi:hypothetical protein